MKTRLPRLPRHSPGFTLVEMLVVLAIISLLAGVVVLNIAPTLLAGSQGKAKAQLQVFSTALQTYRTEHGRYPTREQGLEALVQKPTRPPVPARYPDGGYLNSRTLPLDPWGAPYIYLIPGRSGEAFEVLTYGADGEEGGTGADEDLSTANP